MFKLSFRSRKVTIILLVLSLILAGCQTKSKQRSDGRPPFYRAVKFKTSDGLLLAGRLYGRSETGVILSHMYPANQDSWSNLAVFLSRQGYTVLTYNFRGYWPSQGERQIALIHKDLLAAVKFLRSKAKVKKLFLIGASMGGTASLKALNKVKVNGVVTISSPLAFQGLNLGKNWATNSVPKLFLATANDGQAAFFARQLYEQALEPKELEIYPGSAHGTNIFLTNLRAKLFERISEFLKKFSRYEPY